MAEGNSSYRGLAVPLAGESEIKQLTAATDIITLTAITAATGDFLVCQTAGGGELAVIDANGYLTVQRLVIGSVNSPITAPTTGLTKGEMFLVWSSTTHPVLGMCVSTATQLVQYIAGFNADTLGIPST
jgi:hypothetical protein